MSVDYDKIKYSGEDPDYGDSTAESEQKEPPKKVIKGKVKKRSRLQRMIYVFTGSSSFRNIVDDIIDETIVPAIKDMVAASVHNMTDSIVYGENGSYSRPSRDYERSSSRRGNSRRDYTAPSRHITEREGRRYSRRSVIEPVSFDHQYQAMDVLKELDNEIRRSGGVSVAEFYYITGNDEPIQFNDNYYGWTSVGNCQIRKTRDGWTLFMSDPVSIQEI